MKRIYIATYYQYNNYGTKLQNYAMVETIKELGGFPITIYMNNPMQRLKKNISMFFSYIPIKTNKIILLWKNDRIKTLAFKKFNEKLHFKYYTYKKLYNINFENSAAIVGSDQVWLPKHLETLKKDRILYFLQFVPSSLKFSYAPSFGVSEIPKNMKEMYKKELVDFQRITVREDTGKKIIKELINKDVETMCDPVFLLTKEKWKTITTDNKERNDYIIKYFLGDINECINNEIINYGKRNNYKIITIAGNHIKKNDEVPNPEEFVELIKNAKLILTDSFHASAFAIMMNIPLYVFKRKNVKQFSRIEMLLKKYECTDSIVKDNFNFKIIDKNLPKINDKVDLIIEKERIKGRTYLNEIINGIGDA